MRAEGALQGVRSDLERSPETVRLGVSGGHARLGMGQGSTGRYALQAWTDLRTETLQATNRTAFVRAVGSVRRARCLAGRRPPSSAAAAARRQLGLKRQISGARPQRR